MERQRLVVSTWVRENKTLDSAFHESDFCLSIFILEQSVYIPQCHCRSGLRTAGVPRGLGRSEERQDNERELGPLPPSPSRKFHRAASTSAPEIQLRKEPRGTTSNIEHVKLIFTVIRYQLLFSSFIKTNYVQLQCFTSRCPLGKFISGLFSCHVLLSHMTDLDNIRLTHKPKSAN